MTYCRETIADPAGTLAISDAPAEGWGNDPAYEAFGMETYLGTTVSVRDELYGTLCFANVTARDEPLTDEEKSLVETLGQWVGYVLALQDEQPIREARIDTVEERSVSSDAIGSMMDAFSSPVRREVLVALLGDAGTSIAALEERLSRDDARTQLYHSHLPRLADAGYVSWDTDTATISSGPRFSEVEPLVQLLKEYDTAPPE